MRLPRLQVVQVVELYAPTLTADCGLPGPPSEGTHRWLINKPRGRAASACQQLRGPECELMGAKVEAQTTAGSEPAALPMRHVTPLQLPLFSWRAAPTRCWVCVPASMDAVTWGHVSNPAAAVALQAHSMHYLHCI